MDAGMVFDIQRFCIHDGPGIRTTVFLKGCTLRCFWCHNPESLKAQQELMYYSEKCIHCGFCANVCINGAHEIIDGRHIFNRNKCLSCGKCADGCVSNALTLIGKTMTVTQIMDEIKKDSDFYNTSGGGVTFSGGEPLVQSEFLENLLKECKSLGLHTAVETAGNVEWDCYRRIIPYTDLFLYDIKLIDRERHREATGSVNDKCMQNLKNLHAEHKKILVRVPVIPTINDSEADMNEIVNFVKGIDKDLEIEKMPFHSMGHSKYTALGQAYKAADLGNERG